MATAKHSRITLDLETGADPIRGLIEAPDGTHEPFWGWLELIEQLRRASAEPRPSQQRHPQPHTTTQEQS